MTFIFPRGHISGLTLSTAGSSATFNVAAGQASDSTNAVIMNFAAAMAKTTGAWAAGTGNGALDTGTITINTTYHVHIIERLDTLATDVAISLSPSAPTFSVNIPSAYTLSRRIGAMLTDGSGNWIKFTQYGDRFRWARAVQDVNAANPGTAAVLRALSVPTGIQVQPDITAFLSPTTSLVIAALITSPDETDRAASSSDFDIYVADTAGGIQTGFPVPGVMTNTLGQIRTRISASGVSDTLIINTFGWIDSRGR